MGVAGRLRSAAGLRDGEAGTVAWIAAIFATLEAGRGLGEVGVNTLVLGSLPDDALAWLYIPLGIVSLIVAVTYGAALGRVRRGRLFAATLVAIGVAMLIESIVVSALVGAIPVAWLTVMAAGSIAVTIGWTVATSTLDARQARRLFPSCTAAAIAGAFVGGVSAGPATGMFGAAGLIALEGILFGVAALMIVRLARRGIGAGWATPSSVGRPIVADVRAGFDEVTGSPLLRRVAIAYVLFAILLFSVSFPFLTAASAEFPDPAALAGTLGLINAVVTASSFLVSLLLADRFYRRFGIAAAALVLPLVYVGGFAIWVAAFSFTTAAVVSVVVQVTQRGLSNAAWSAFYNVVPASRRAQALAFNDGVPGQIGIMLSGVLLLTVTRLLAPEQVFWLGLATAVACVAVVVGIRRRYGEALIGALRRGVGERVLEGGPGLGDLVAAPDVRAALLATLDAPEAPAREMAAVLLSRSPGPEGRAGLAAALDDPSPAVRAAAAAGLLDGTPDGPTVVRAEATIDALLDGDTAARVAGLRALERLGRSIPEGRLTAATSDPEPEVRAACMAVMRGDRDERAIDALVAGLVDPSAAVRLAAAASLAARDRVDPRVLALLDDVQLPIQATTIEALAGHGTDTRDAVLAWADRHVTEARATQGAHDALLGDGTTLGDPDGAFLVAVLAQRTAAHRDLVLAAMTILGTPAATGVLRRGLGSPDGDIRAQAIEALDSVGERRLGRALADLADPAGPPAAGDRDATLERLRDDEDPWIRRLARRVRPHEGDVTDTAGGLGDLETMLQLRRVPLFERLTPEDLQRVAMVATERSFAPEEVLVQQGDPGHELFVILEGRVRVVVTDGVGSSRIVRTYADGDHIGELAVLRERPRAATVIADGVVVRTLVLDGDGLTAILRERPDAAMAMLATLAERIGTQ